MHVLYWQYVASTKEKGPKKLISGVIQITRKGTGYVSWSGEPDKEDIEIKTEALGGALNGDTVEIEIAGLFPRPQGKVRRVVTRAKTEFVATLKEEKTRKALEYGAVDLLILSRAINKTLMRELIKIAENTGATFEIVSTETEEGEQFNNLGGIGAILRFRI